MGQGLRTALLAALLALGPGPAPLRAAPEAGLADRPAAAAGDEIAPAARAGDSLAPAAEAGDGIAPAGAGEPPAAGPDGPPAAVPGAPAPLPPPSPPPGRTRLALLGPAAGAGAAALRPGAPDAAALPRPLARDLSGAPSDRRCTADGSHCITLASYVPDVCRTIEEVAGKHAVDPHFFARLLWKESLFDAGAVSPAGAQGIAQFMPGTAALRGLKDAFNPAEALAASAHYLADLTEMFGNVGLAAVAYNGGEARAARFVAGAGGLPAETRDYVQAITGHSAETWRDAPPASLDLALDAARDFRPACVAIASSRSLREFRTAPEVLPWGVVIASNRDRDGAARQVARLKNRHAAVLRGEAVTYVRTRRAGTPRPLHFAQVGRATREGADAFCARLRAAGGDCMVLRN